MSELLRSLRALWRSAPAKRATALTLPSALGAAIAAWFSQLSDDSFVLALGVACGALAGAAYASRIGLEPPEADPETEEGPAADATPAAAVEASDPLGGGRAALEGLPAPTLLIDATGRILFANAAAESELGVALAGRHYSARLRAPGFFEAIESALSAAETGSTPASGRGAARPGGPAAYGSDPTGSPGRFGVERPGAAAARTFTFSLHGRQERHIEAFVTPLAAEGSDAPDGGPAAERPAALVLLLDQTRARRAEQLHRDFVANASHELKTPLASIAGFIETLQGPARGDEDARDRFLAIMAQQAERMRLLVNDLMSLNRIELNEHVRPRDTVDVRSALDDAIAIAAPGRRRRVVGAEIEPDRPGVETKEAGPPLEIEWDGAGPVIRGDRGELTQLFANLISNAIKYGGSKRGPRIALQRAEEADAGGEADRIGVTVEDFGPGIAREHLPRLTERFYRVQTPSARAVGGTGLGLAIVKHVLARHRGELQIDSALGRGSRFTAWLPAGLEPSEAEETSEAASGTASAAAEATPARSGRRAAGGADRSSAEEGFARRRPASHPSDPDAAAERPGAPARARYQETS